MSELIATAAPLGLALTAGIATIASPCVLPVLPLLLGAGSGAPGAAARERWRPPAVVAGFVLGFVGLTLLFGGTAHVAGIPAEALRTSAALVMLAAGVLMLLPAWGERAFAPAERLASALQRWLPGGRPGPAGSVLLGATLGLSWAPCAGPVLAAILALVAGAQPGDAAPLLTAYGLGAGLPMLAIAFGGQWAMDRLKPLARHARRVRQGLGAMVVLVAVAMLARWDAPAVAWLTDKVSGSVSPSWIADAGASTATPTTLANGAPAPELAGIEAWLNSEPLRLAELRGKVVLLDFWTFGCVNCIRTLPNVRSWHARYATQGLVVIGVHTPEFAHERPLPALRDAVARHGLRYPIAQDNAYRSWNAYGVRYWPAQILIDRDGRIAWRHYGEGGEADTEARIRALLQAR
jgi:cytochrome c biogenesis protein CcdA/thiol-disulfide isomerase/thioredoxin